ncbi:hypothetical protein [Filimonas effusa]|uniref:Uncharacterized protein n=1 Tax=Filimonas effusa TaxID=2508721 RepID=A0A4Q1DDE1_9BACT|nr:hypothetical protein [Filimonas effusa]RXK86988.1 hypothetical protein ESB13_09455 [Filimonas effusa]
MKKNGTMIVGIADATVKLAEASARVIKKAKDSGLFTTQEISFIVSFFNEMLKEPNQYVEKVKNLLIPKQNVSEDEKEKQLLHMHSNMRRNQAETRKIEKSFERLVNLRIKRSSDMEEVKDIFKTSYKSEK